MDQTYLLALAIAIVAALAAAAAVRGRRRAKAEKSESRLAVSTEGMKLCASCAMGNAWTASTCMSCGAPLRG